MKPELKRLLAGKLLAGDSATERRVNPVDRRKVNTYVFPDRRSGLADRRADTTELIKRFLVGYKRERRLAVGDRRQQPTFIMNDRRSGVADRRSGS